jgi:hypothetical protein
MRKTGWKDLLAHLVALATVQRGPMHDGEVAETGVKCVLVNVLSVWRQETQVQRPASSEQECGGSTSAPRRHWELRCVEDGGWRPRATPVLWSGHT